MDDLKIGLLLKNAVTTRLSTLTQLCSMTRLAKKGTTAEGKAKAKGGQASSKGFSTQEASLRGFK